jgi:hypothetical protein
MGDLLLIPKGSISASRGKRLPSGTTNNHHTPRLKTAPTSYLRKVTIRVIIGRKEPHIWRKLFTLFRNSQVLSVKQETFPRLIVVRRRNRVEQQAFHGFAPRLFGTVGI